MSELRWSNNDFAALKARCWPLVEGELTQVVPNVTEPPADADGARWLAHMTWYHLGTGGKRLRALIPVAVAEALGAPAADAVPMAAAVEMLHNATLVHDDLQDGDTHRRGIETVWRRYGAPQSINCGDAMFYYTLLLAQRTPRPAEVVVALERRVLEHTLDVIAGQAAEFALKDAASPGVDDYLRVVRGKTSGLFTLPLVAGAMVAGASSELVRRLEALGNPLGELFQVQDDLLDLVGDKGRDARATDIAEGKISLPAAHLLERGAPEVASAFREVLARPREETSAEDIERALGWLSESGSLAFAAALIRDRDAQVRALAEELDCPPLAALVRGLAAVFLAPIQDYLSRS